MKPRKPWADTSARLKRLYQERVPPGMTQKEFGRRYGIGTQSMVSQHLNGERPLTYEAAAKYAIGLRCTIYDISPEMGDSIRNELIPVLGKSLRKAAMLLLALSAGPYGADSEARTILHNQSPYYTMIDIFNRLLRWLTFQKLTLVSRD